MSGDHECEHDYGYEEVVDLEIGLARHCRLCGTLMSVNDDIAEMSPDADQER